MFEKQLNATALWAKTAAFFAALALLMALSPMQWTSGEGIPITLQSLLVVLLPAILGWKSGTLAVVIYLIAGGFGAPVFAYGTFGWERFTGSTGGFLLAFPLAAMLSGWAMETSKNRKGRPSRAAGAWSRMYTRTTYRSSFQAVTRR